MKFYTSFFGNVGNIKEDMVFVSISRWDSKWKGWKLKKLAPDEDLLIGYKNGKIDEKGYVERFNRKLDGIDCLDLVRKFKDKFGDRNICFLCYEGKGKFCHRYLVSDWLKSNGIDCKEY